TLIRDPLMRLCHWLMAFSIAGRSQALEKASPAAAPAARTMPQRMVTLEEEVHGLHESLGEQRAVLDEMSRYFSRFMMWVLSRLLQEVLQLPM
ncbi:hypothetical protein Tco_1161006, partial [Tanacetum coccineum]